MCSVSSTRRINHLLLEVFHCIMYSSRLGFGYTDGFLVVDAGGEVGKEDVGKAIGRLTLG